MPRHHHYILDADNRPVAVGLDEWAMWFETADRRVAYTEITSQVFVSTVFLGIDHRFGYREGPPLLFETMVFKDKETMEEDGCWRYSSWDDAQAGHDAVVKRLRKAMLRPAARTAPLSSPTSSESKG